MQEDCYGVIWRLTSLEGLRRARKHQLLRAFGIRSQQCTCIYGVDDQSLQHGVRTVNMHEHRVDAKIISKMFHLRLETSAIAYQYDHKGTG